MDGTNAMNDDYTLRLILAYSSALASGFEHTAAALRAMIERECGIQRATHEEYDAFLDAHYTRLENEKREAWAQSIADAFDNQSNARV